MKNILEDKIKQEMCRRSQNSGNDNIETGNLSPLIKALLYIVTNSIGSVHEPAPVINF